MKRPEEGALGGPVLAGNPVIPVTDPMVAGVCRGAPSAAIAPPGATQADRAVEPMGIGPTRNQATAIYFFWGSPLRLRIFSMVNETAHVGNTPGKGSFRRAMGGH